MARGHDETGEVEQADQDGRYKMEQMFLRDAEITCGEGFDIKVEKGDKHEHERDGGVKQGDDHV